jgi:thioredoxin reductase (NADPH)
VVRDEQCYLVTGPDLRHDGRYPISWPLDRDPYYLETSTPGLFAACDVRHGSVKRCASAVGEGAMAVAFAYRYLESHEKVVNFPRSGSDSSFDTAGEFN